MERIIKNGMTIIKTGDAVGGTKNKLNYQGVSQHINHKGKIKYKSELTYKRKKYYIGMADTPEEAAVLRLEAEAHVVDGSFLEWIKTVKSEATKSRNKHNQAGISIRQTAKTIKYVAAINIKKQKYHLGTYITLEEAVAVRQEADVQLKNGTFENWYKNTFKK